MSGRRKGAVHVITMGCAKNTVDSERLLAQLRLNSVAIAPSLEDADIAVINTCGFIDAAKQESIDAIIQQVRRKGSGKLKKVYAMGCLSQRYRIDLSNEIPEVDRFFGTDELADVLRELGGDLRRDLLGERELTTPRHSAFLKISEGCDNPCSFCAIPLMRGGHASTPMESIITEATLLAGKGVKELVVIAQDTTYYGLDIYGERRLPELLERLCAVEGIAWVRLMYAYPAKFPTDVLRVMAEHPQICRYLDIPVQHIADPVLRSMRRGISSRALRELLETIRARVPGVALRTTLIVGYPGEGEREFEELQEFVREQEFDRLGVFTYSHEEGTTAYPLGDPVLAEEKQRRLNRIMELQQEISERKNAALVGTTQRVLLDRVEGDRLVGRTERDAPEIDNEVFVTSDSPLRAGEFCSVRIDDATEYDLYGSVVGEAATASRGISSDEPGHDRI
ncbi:MAG TPA: 30S ribosomal protein S12 methylthiotransferase RimO [Bacteroidota bacterium]|nr:30S ribosomal protein S12 methylthiotransferase RimO [Bacteroidota bacterium]